MPHRQYVFTVPKLIRPFFTYRRSLLGELCRIIAQALHLPCLLPLGDERRDETADC